MDAPFKSDATTLIDGTTPGDVSDARMIDVTVPLEGACVGGQIECAGACVDPSSPANCGVCNNACEGDGACAESADGSFACVTSSCPAATPLSCGTICIDPTTDPVYCGNCDTACATTVANAQPTCVNSTCSYACDTSYTMCGSRCVDEQTDSDNCGGCGTAYACVNGATCVAAACQGSGTVPCPPGGCPSSTPTSSGYSACPFGSCNGSTTSTCSGGGPCVCVSDSQCTSGHCVTVAGENDQSCAGNCTGTGERDGFDCELASPGIPVPAGATAYSCPASAGYHSSPLTCQASHSDCFCTADSQCPSGMCIANAANNNSCSGAGPCSGTGTPDYRGCEPPSVPEAGVCDNDNECESGQCASGSCSPSSNCTGTGTAQTNGCVAPPASIACTSSAGTACTTTLTPTPVLNSASTACLCVADSDCSSGKCVNADSQCSPASGCTGGGSHDSEDCETVTSVALAWSCSIGNCDTVTSPSGVCTAAGVPCWCTSDSQCVSGSLCASWAGCAAGACSGTGTGNAFNCVP